MTVREKLVETLYAALEAQDNDEDGVYFGVGHGRRFPTVDGQVNLGKIADALIESFPALASEEAEK